MLISVHRCCRLLTMTKKKYPPRIKPHSRRSLSKQLANSGRKGNSSHKGTRLQVWSTDDMRNALVMYFSQRAPGYVGPTYGYKKIAGTFRIPRETFRRRLSGPLQGLFGHLSGGKDLPRIFTCKPHKLICPSRFSFHPSRDKIFSIRICWWPRHRRVLCNTYECR